VNAILVIGRVEARGISRRRWAQVVILVGAVIIVAGAIIAAGRDGLAASDTMRSWTASVELVMGLVLAAALGAGTVNRDADAGWVGMQVATGTPRGPVALGRIFGRLVILLAGMFVWILVAIACSIIIGQGVDGALVVNGLAMTGNMVLVLTAAALCSVALGPVASGVVAVFFYVSCLSLVNLAAASDANAIGTVWSPLIKGFYAVFPRSLTSPMLSDLQARDAAGVAATQVEVNSNIVIVPPASWLTVAWTLIWCVVLALATSGALRKRALS
jgi:ABC-type transport system involved in multi-copper enzyme maturation permease subunit